MTQMNKFDDLNGRFTSLETGMTQQRKFRDRWCTLLYIFHTTTYEDDFYIRIIAFNEIHYFLAFEFFIWDR
jgi:hypothetical protein